MRRLYLTTAALFAALPAFAAQPTPGGINFQDPATRIAERQHEFHGMLLWIIGAISLFVLALLILVAVRFNRRANPVASKNSHNTLLEVAWTVVPALILVVIAGPSFPNLYYQDVPPNLKDVQTRAAGLAADGNQAALDRYLKDHNPEAAAKGFINVKAQGNQWNWTYTYLDVVDETGAPLVEYVSNGLHKGRPDDPAATADQPRNLAVDYPMVIPAGRYVRYYTAAADVIHSWTVPAFGVKTDAVPGRLNEGWFLVDKPGIYYGQCSELCGVDHAYMPIEVRVVPEAQYARWLDLMKAGDIDGANATVRSIAALEPTSRFASATR